MRLVVVESPYALDGKVERNVKYARAALADCLSRHEAPYASHLLYTQPGVLDDTIPSERALGMNAGFEWGDRAEATVVYMDYGITPGMQNGIDRALQANRPIEYRHIVDWTLHNL